MKIIERTKPLQLSIAVQHILLAAVLIVSFLLRWGLAFQGGQFFNPDEYRYLYCREVARDIQKGDYAAALTELTREAAHQGFKFLGVIPAMVELKRGENSVIPALFFGLFSLINIALIWLLALRLGGDKTEALLASFLAAASSTLFYYSSHLFPYDPAMTFGLLALYIGLRRESGIWTSMLTGVFGFLAFFIYNGYWALVGFIFIVHILFAFGSYTRLFSRTVFAGLGFFATLLLLVRINGQFGNDLMQGYGQFSDTITNGNFSEGAILPFEYLWTAEHFLLIVWLLLISYAIVMISRSDSQRVIIWVGGALFIYACFVISSMVLHKFVVYGRLVREMVPFLVLASAYGFRMIEGSKRWGRLITVVILAVVILQAGLNFRRPFLIIYPLNFANQARKVYPYFKPPKNMTYYYTSNVIDVGPYKAYYIKYIFLLPDEIPPVDGKILMSAEHPLSSFPPFRYEDGYAPQERIAFPISLSKMMVVQSNP